MKYFVEGPKERRQIRQKLAFSISGDLYDTILEKANDAGKMVPEYIETLLKRAVTNESTTALEAPPSREPRLDSPPRPTEAPAMPMTPSRPQTYSERSMRVPGDPRYATMRDFADRFGMSESTICRMAIQGDLPSFRIGRRRLIPVAEALEAIRKQNEPRVPRDTSFHAALLKKQREEQARAKKRAAR